jgi:branched-chain amino acid transport system permease protein
MTSVILNGILIGGVYALLALGLVMIYGVMRIVNLGHGPLVALAGYITFSICSLLKVDPMILLPLNGVLFYGLGILVYKTLFKPVISKSRIVTLILTMGLGYIIQSLILIVWGADYRSILTPYSSRSITVAGIPVSFMRTILFLLAFFIIVLMYIVLNRTKIGKAMLACSQNLEGAKIVGINVDKVFEFTNGISFAVVGIAGTMIAMIIVLYPTVGDLFTLKSFCINVLGGLGSVIGIPIGGIILGLAESISSIFLPVMWNNGVAFLILVLVLLVRPTGFFGRPENL